MIYGIVKEHQGAIKIHSKIGKSSTFNIYLPFMEKIRDTETTEVTNNHQGGNKHILMVDDEKSIANLEKNTWTTWL